MVVYSEFIADTWSYSIVQSPDYLWRLVSCYSFSSEAYTLVLALATLRFQGSKSGAVEAGTVVVKLLNRVGQSPN